MKILIAAIVLSVDLAQAHGADATRWKISGEWEEACSCDAACPCWFDSNPTRMNCRGGQALFIDKGHYGGIHLDGLAIANLSQSPRGEKMSASYGRWDFSNNFIDARANTEQRAALKALADALLPGNASRKSRTRIAKISRRVVGDEHEIRVGNEGSFRGHLLRGGLGGAPTINNPPWADPLRRAYRQGRTTSLMIANGRTARTFRATNYMNGKFSATSEDYARFNATRGKKW